MHGAGRAVADLSPRRVGGGAPRQACWGARLMRSVVLTRPGAQQPVLGLFT